MNTKPRLVVCIDVDDTLVRSAGSKTMPVPLAVEHTKDLAAQGAELYCWSTAGAEYARHIAQQLGIEQCFAGFLPKPNVLIDDQEPSAWKQSVVIHPLNISARTVDEYCKLTESIPS